MRLFSRFPFKLGALFLVLIAIMGVGSVLIALRIFERRQAEIDQRLNSDVAASMAAEIEPHLKESETGDAVGSIMHYMMVMNPAVEIYLLDGEGPILDYFAYDGPDAAIQEHCQYNFNIIITDGEPTMGKVQEPNEIRRRIGELTRLRKVKIHGIAIGRSSRLLRWLAEDSGGQYVQIL